MYILLSKRIAIEGVMGGSSPYFVLVLFMQNCAILGNTYLCINERIVDFETNGYLNRDIGEARNLFIKKIALVSPPITKYLENRLFSVSFFQGQHIYFQIVSPPPPDQNHTIVP